MVRSFHALLAVVIAVLLATAPGYARADEKKKSDPDKEKKAAPEGEQGFLGVNLRGEEDGGVFVDSVTEDGPAAKAGVKDGDKIIKLNDKEVKGAEQLAEQIHAMKPGQTVTLTVKRDDKEMKIKVTLGKRT